MRTDEVAAELGISTPSVNALLISGKLKGEKVEQSEGARMKVWKVRPEDLTAYQLTHGGKKKRKPYTKKNAAAVAHSSNGHQRLPKISKTSREPQIRQVIDSWVDALVEGKRIPGLGDLTRNDVADLARRIWRVV